MAPSTGAPSVAACASRPGALTTHQDGRVHDSDLGVHDADPGVHDPDPSVHDAPIFAFTFIRSRRSRSRGTRSAPVLLISERHTDGKGYMEPPQFGDESAVRLITDCIIANP